MRTAVLFCLLAAVSLPLTACGPGTAEGERIKAAAKGPSNPTERLGGR